MLKFVQERVLTLLKLTRLPEKKDEVDLVNVIVMYECVCTRFVICKNRMGDWGGGYV